MGLSDYPSNSQKRLEGVAVGLFVRYGRVSFSRMGVQRAATSFPADMASNMPHMRNELRPRC
jgi:hypothetical protein